MGRVPANGLRPVSRDRDAPLAASSSLDPRIHGWIAIVGPLVLVAPIYGDVANPQYAQILEAARLYAAC